MMTRSKKSGVWFRIQTELPINAIEGVRRLLRRKALALIDCVLIIMSNQFNEEEFISQCGKGNVDAAKRKLEKDNVNVNCK